MLITCIWCIVLFLVYIIYSELKSSKTTPPGPLKIPIIGNIIELGLMRKKFGLNHLVWKHLMEKYGSVVQFKLGSTNVVLVSELSLIKEVGLNESLQGRPDGFFYRKRALGSRAGLAFTEGPLWSEQRRFCLTHLRNFGLRPVAMEKLISEEADYLVEWLNKFNEEPMNVDSSFNRFILNIIWNFVAGKRYHYEDPKLLHICEVIDKSFRRMTTAGSLLNQLPFLRFLAPNFSGYTEYCTLQKEIIKFIQESIEEHKLSYNPDKQDDLIDAVLHQMRGGNKDSKFTDVGLFVICLDLLQAGTDTTSNTLSFIVCYLMNHQEVQRKVHEEIDKVIGQHRKPTLIDKCEEVPTFFSMPYLTAVIQEVQRIVTIPPGGVAHRATKHTSLGKYTISKNTVIIPFLYGVHKNEMWKDPYVFRPERFLDEVGNIKSVDSFLPFGFGKRRCVGEVLAKSILFMFCCHIFQRFHLLPLTSAPMLVQDGITLSPAPFKAIWKKRNV